MTIWFSTNIPEMRAISTFNRVSTDIGEIQHRITTGQRINSGKDDPGGLIVREGLRADIKGIQATQANMLQAEILTNTAADGMMQLLELLRGADTKDPSNGGLIGELNGSLDYARKQAVADDFMKLYDAVVSTTTYGTDAATGVKVKLLDGTLTTTPKTYLLGGDDGGGSPYTLTVEIADLSSGSGAAQALQTAIASISSDADVPNAIAAAETLLATISRAAGTLGAQQKVIATNQQLLDSRLTNVTSAEGKISNADIAIESSRMARAELLAQNAMSSVMYTRNYAAFAVSSLFR